MREAIRAPRPSRSHSEQPTSEAWHDFSRYVASSRATTGRQIAVPGGTHRDDPTG